MTIPAAHKDTLVAYLAEHSEQRYGQICEGMRRDHPEVRVTIYLLKLLWRDGRVERAGFDCWRVPHAETEVAS